jgi:membrane protease YdiL (CAAX protease family)
MNGCGESEGMSQEARDDQQEAGDLQDRTRSVFVSAITLVIGGAVAAFLTRYNLQPHPVWMSGDTPIFRTWEEYLLVNVTGLLLIPCLCILAMPREDPARFGWARPTPSASRIALGLYLAMLPILFIASRWPEFQQYYPIQPQAAASWTYLIYFELTYGFYMLTWEFFFRGFLTLGMTRGFGPITAVVLQALAFGVMHIGKPMPEMIGSFAAGIALGWLALRGQSFLHCFALHWACAVTFDLLVIRAGPGGLF